MCYRSTTQCCRLSVFTGCNGKGVSNIDSDMLFVCHFRFSVDTRRVKIFKQRGGVKKKVIQGVKKKKKSKLSTLPLTQMPPKWLHTRTAFVPRINTHAQPSSNRRCASHSNGLTSGQILTRAERSRERERPRDGEQIERFISGVHSLHV